MCLKNIPQRLHLSAKTHKLQRWARFLCIVMSWSCHGHRCKRESTNASPVACHPSSQSWLKVTCIGIPSKFKTVLLVDRDASLSFPLHLFYIKVIKYIFKANKNKCFIFRFATSNNILLNPPFHSPLWRNRFHESVDLCYFCMRTGFEWH